MITTRITPSVQQVGRFACVVVLGLAAVVSAKAEEGTYAQRMACTPDAWRLCSDEIPDVGAVKACIIAKRAQLSPACRAVLPKQSASR